MPMPEPDRSCPECGGYDRHHPWEDILILRCKLCGFAIGADDLHDVEHNWNRRARTRTEVEAGPDVISWRLSMTDVERMDLIGCGPSEFARLKAIPLVTRP